MKSKLITEITPNAKLKLPQKGNTALTVNDLADFVLLITLTFGIFYFGWGILASDFSLAEFFKGI